MLSILLYRSLEEDLKMKRMVAVLFMLLPSLAFAASSDSTSVNLNSYDEFPVIGSSCTALSAQKVDVNGTSVACFPDAGGNYVWQKPASSGGVAASVVTVSGKPWDGSKVCQDVGGSPSITGTGLSSGTRYCIRLDPVTKVFQTAISRINPTNPNPLVWHNGLGAASPSSDIWPFNPTPCPEIYAPGNFTSSQGFSGIVYGGCTGKYKTTDVYTGFIAVP